MKANRSFNFLNLCYKKIKTLEYFPILAFRTYSFLEDAVVTKPLSEDFKLLWSSGYKTEAEVEKLVIDFFPIGTILKREMLDYGFWIVYYEEMIYKLFDFMESLSGVGATQYGNSLGIVWEKILNSTN